MRQDHTWPSEGEQQNPLAASWPHARWFSVCLFLLVAACTSVPASSSVTPTVTRSAQPTTIAAYHGHTSTVFAVAWSPDGRYIASGGNDSTVQIWDASSGKRQLTYTGHLGSIWAVAWSPDGRRITSGGNDGTVQIWDAMTGHHLLTYRGQNAPVRGVTWSPDGTRIASVSQDGTVQVWNAATGHRLFTYSGHTAPVWAVAWSPSGKCIASASGNISDERPKETVQVWNALTRHLISSYPVAASSTYADGTLSVAWSQDSAHIASGGADTEVHLWSAPACRV